MPFFFFIYISNCLICWDCLCSEFKKVKFVALKDLKWRHMRDSHEILNRNLTCCINFLLMEIWWEFFDLLACCRLICEIWLIICPILERKVQSFDLEMLSSVVFDSYQLKKSSLLRQEKKIFDIETVSSVVFWFVPKKSSLWSLKNLRLESSRALLDGSAWSWGILDPVLFFFLLLISYWFVIPISCLKFTLTLCYKRCGSLKLC